MKIFIAVPTYENITPDTYKSIYGLFPAGHQLVFDFIRGYDCAVARNRIAEQTLREGADFVLMVDNDVVLPSDALVNLLDDTKDVCLGAYPIRNSANQYDGNTCLCRLGEFDYTDMIPAQEIFALRSVGIYKRQIHGGGMGCALIRADVFRQIEKPWFKWKIYDV